MKRSSLLLLLFAALTVAAHATPTLRSTFRPKGGTVTALAFRPDGLQLAIGTRDGIVRIRNLAAGETAIHTMRDTAGWLAYSPIVYNTHAQGASKGVGSLVALSPSGRFQVFYTDDYDIQTESEVGPVHGDKIPFGTLSGDGRYLAFSKGGPDLWIGRPAEARTHSRRTPPTDWSSTVMGRPEGIVGDVASLALNGNGSLLAAVYHKAQGGAVVIFNRRTGRTSRIHHLDFAPDAVAYSRKGNHLAAVGNGKIWLGAPSGEQGKILPAPPSTPLSIVFSPGERWLAAACVDGTIYVWDVAAGHEVGRLHAHDGKVTALAWAPKKRLLATGGDDGVVKVWELPAR